MISAEERELKELLKNSGYKFTGQRNAVLEVLIRYRGQHLTTEEIYRHVRENHPEIGLATVYRTLTLLDGLKLITRLDLDDGYSRYELARQNEDHRHHHLICSQCGSVSEVEEDLLDALEEQILNKNDFQVTDHRVKFYGLCGKCRKH